MEKPVISPQAYTFGCEVCMYSFTFTPLRRSSTDSVSIPRLRMLALRPTLTSILSASIFSVLPSFSTITLSCVTSITFVSRKNSTPLLEYSARSMAEASLSIAPSISGIISITFTLTPILLKKEANSIPITPPPIIAIDRGSSFISSASLEVQ